MIWLGGRVGAFFDQANIRAGLHRLWASFRPGRWPVFYALTILCLVLRENYPFSNFPMYSSFAKNSYYIYLADKTGEPLATRRFGLTTPGLKKIFESKRRSAFRRSEGTAKPDSAILDQAAGAALLDYLERLPAVQPQRRSILRGLQVRRVNLFCNAGRIEAGTEIVAQHR